MSKTPIPNVRYRQFAYRRFFWAIPVLILLHGLLCWQLVERWWSAPLMRVVMTSTTASRAQVYYDVGAGMSETQSETVPVHAGSEPQVLLFPLPRATFKAFRFDPLAAPGTVLVEKIEIVRSNGSIADTISPARIHGILGFDQEERVGTGVRYRVRNDSYDPQLSLDVPTPIDLESYSPGAGVLLRILLANLGLLLFEGLFLGALARARLVLDLVRRVSPRTALLLVPHLFLSWLILTSSFSPPVLLVEMSSTVYSRAQVYYDAGLGLNETQSSSAPVRPSAALQELRLPLPHARIKYLRFDPLTCPGTIVLGKVQVLRSDGTVALAVPASRIRGILGFDRMNNVPTGVKYHVRSDSYDPALLLELDAPLDLQSRVPGFATFGLIALVNLVLLTAEVLLFLYPPVRNRFTAVMGSLDRSALTLASRLSQSGFLAVDRLAIWFYVTCAVLFLVFTAADFNGSSMEVFWRNYKVGAPPRAVVGTPQQIRADEFNYETPGILNQALRDQKFETAYSSFGAHSTALFGSLPVRHISTLARPQYWPFFLLRADYAFAAWWQAKWLIFLTGTFTFLLLLTQSGTLALAGATWLFFSQFTQWCYTWPSMLPEMGGLLCFAVVFACYLTVGSRALPLGLAALGCAVCACDFALFSYVPHLIPYFWAALFVFVGWCGANWTRIARRDSRWLRIIAGLACVVVAAAVMSTVFRDGREAIAGIAATAYPGHRSLSGGEITLATFFTHLLGAFESETRFPPGYSNICESAGFLWLAPFTVLALARMRALPRERQILLAALWAAAVLLAGWMLLPIPASLGQLLFLNKVQGVRVLPALGLLNVAIVMVVLSSPDRSKRLELSAKVAILVPIVLLGIVLANLSIGAYFTFYEVLAGGVWTGVLAALVWHGNRRLFMAGIVIPHILLFGLINPVQRGIDTVTASTLFEIVHKDRDLLKGKWLIFPDKFPASIFIAVGCDVYNGSKYLPDLDHFPLLARHGVDTKLLNNLGYLDIEELKPGQAAVVRRGPYGVILSMSPLDPLVKELGIRYLAFHKRPSDEVAAHLKPIGNGHISEFWLYELL